jgi:NADH:ubiquinone oxidoreductase subunit E
MYREQIAENDPLMILEKRAMIDQILEENEGRPGATMVVLNELQSQIGFITEPMQAYVAQKLHVPLSAIHGVVTFYSFFTTKPRGRHTIKFCMGTACYVGGTPQLIESKTVLGVDGGHDCGRWITLEICRCVERLQPGPVVVGR